MRTKLFTLIAAIAFTFGATNAFAEGGDGGPTPVVTNEVKLTIELKPIQTLVVNQSQNSVVLTYETLEHYEKGVTSKSLPEHLSVTSTGAYEVRVKAEKDVFETDDIDKLNVISVSDITIKPTSSNNDISLTNQTLPSGEAKQIASSNVGSVGEKINVEYSAAGGNKYLIENYVRGKKVTLTNTVTYTIVAK